MGKIKNNSRGRKRILKHTLVSLILVFPLLFLGVAQSRAATQQIAMGDGHTLILKSDGTLWACEKFSGQAWNISIWCKS